MTKEDSSTKTFDKVEDHRDVKSSSRDIKGPNGVTRHVETKTFSWSHKEVHSSASTKRRVTTTTKVVKK
jgi:hypothetical protein